MNENKNIIPVKIADLITENLQIRVEMNEECIKDYAEIYGESPDKMPPITVYHDEKTDKYYLADGFHRVIAAKRAGLETIQATVLEGTFDDALKFALCANDKHGLRRTNADKHNAMEIAWENWPQLFAGEKLLGTTDNKPNGLPSSRQLASKCGVSNRFAAYFLEKNGVCTVHTPPANSADNAFERTPNNGDTMPNNQVRANAPDATTVTSEHLEERNASVRQNLKEHKDRYGMEIPERLLPAFLSSEPRLVMRKLGTIRAFLEKKRLDGDIAFAQSLAFAIRDLDATIRALRQGAVHCVCRMCRGRGCGSCSDLGFQTRLQYERNPPEFK